MTQGVVTHEWGFLPGQMHRATVLNLQGLGSPYAFRARNYYETSCQHDKHLGGKSQTNLSKTSVPQTSVNTVTSVLQSLHSGIRIELIN